MATLVPRTPGNRLRVTTKVFLKRSGATGFEDIGNVLEFKDNKKLESVEHKSAGLNGVLVVDDKQVHTVGSAFEFKFDESSIANVRRMLQAEANTTTSQAANATLAVSIASVTKGLSYYVGARNLSGHALTFGGTSKTEGTDFVLDKKAGMVTILSAGAIANGAAVAGTVNCAAVESATWTQDKEFNLQVGFRIEQYDELGWRATWSGAYARATMMNLGERNPGAFNEPQAVIVPMGDVTYEERTDLI